MSSPQALYRFFAADGTLLYIGVSLNPGERWKDHRANKPWWLEVCNITLEHYPDRPAVLDAEKAAIRAENPLYNIAHNDAARLAEMLTKSDRSDRFLSACPHCASLVLPGYLFPEVDGWLALYDCCDERSWQRELSA